MSRQIIVLGAGIVGVSVAYHLVRAGYEVTLIDRRDPGEETSFGNAGIIQREAVEPYPFPREFGALVRAASNRRIDIRYGVGGLVSSARPLFHYWRSSASPEYERIVDEYASLIALATDTHAPMIEAAGAQDLISRDGWLELYRTESALQERGDRARSVHARHGVEFAVLDRSALERLEPHLSVEAIGAIHWRNSWTVADPAALVGAYARLFEAAGGRLLRAGIEDIQRAGGAWSVTTTRGRVRGSDVVLALGPWSREWTRRLGYRLPLFPLRGYHMHYAHDASRPLRHWFMDAEVGYLVEPMARAIRLTTGAELERQLARPRRDQLDAAEMRARELFPALGKRVDARAWLGARPCCADMKPIIGSAPRDAGLWFACGHGHQGLTLGPATGLLLAQMMCGAPPAIDPRPFSPARFE